MNDTQILGVRFLTGFLVACFEAAGMNALASIVIVLYAGSLVTPMEGPVASTLRTQGIIFQGESGGSKKLANLIAAGLKKPDVFISVDPQLVTGLGDKVAHAKTFASTSLGIGWADTSKDAALFAAVAAGKTPLLDALRTPGLRIGRTDPKLDPKGRYTVQGMTMFAGPLVAHQILGDDDNAAQVFPEEDLLVRIEGGEADVGFLYRTEAIARGLHFIPLPGAVALRDKITYTIAVMKNAPDPDAASAFVRFMTTGAGKEILERAGLEYLP